MKLGDLVKYKHFDETAIVIKVHANSDIDVLSNLGEVAVFLSPKAFEVINESR